MEGEMMGFGDSSAQQGTTLGQAQQMGMSEGNYGGDLPGRSYPFAKHPNNKKPPLTRLPSRSFQFTESTNTCSEYIVRFTTKTFWLNTCTHFR